MRHQEPELHRAWDQVWSQLKDCRISPKLRCMILFPLMSRWQSLSSYAVAAPRFPSILYPPQLIQLLFCWDQLDKQGFQKCDTAREWETRHKNLEKSKDQGINTTPRWRSRNWIQASFIILPAVNERICGELNYNSCGLQGQRTKWSLTIE